MEVMLNSPFGRYKFKRLPFGVLHASEVFQDDVAEILEGIEGVQNAQYDIMVWGKTKTEHDKHLRNVLHRICDYGLKLNKDKCIFNVPEVTYLGHTLTSKGVKPDPGKAKAITEMQFPQSKQELRTFLGMITYLGKFVPNLSDITTPLRDLLEKDLPISQERLNQFKHETEVVSYQRSNHITIFVLKPH